MKNTIDNAQANTELEFAYQVRRALDEQLTALPASTTDRLYAARKMAIARKKPNTVYATAPRFAGAFAGALGAGNPFDESLSWLGRVGIAIPLLVLILGGFGIYQLEQERRINDLADIDTAVLTDELPLSAFLDHGFETYLSKHGE